MYGFRYGYHARQRSVRGWGAVEPLFANGEPGIWIDPSDLSTLFQDTAGTIPVTAPGQQVALALDKSGRGGRLIQPTALARPTLGRHPVGGRRNLFIQTEALTGSAWADSGTTRVDVGGGVVAVAENTASGYHGVSRNAYISFTAGVSYTVSIEAKLSVGTRYARMFSGDITKIAFQAVFDLVAGTVISGAGATITPLGDGWYRLSQTRTAIASGSEAIIPACLTSGSLYYVGDGTSTILFRKPHIQVATTETAYQKVVTDWDVTEEGKLDCYYLGFDGVDDSMTSEAVVDFSASSAVTLFAGIRKEGTPGASAHLICELGPVTAYTPGTFFLASPVGPSRDNSGVALRGASSPVSAESAYNTAVPPATVVICGRGDTSSGVSFRQNGVQVRTNASGGGGNFASAHRLYVGWRAGGIGFFKGKLYQLIIRGADTSDAQVVAVEAEVSRKMGLTP